MKKASQRKEIDDKVAGIMSNQKQVKMQVKIMTNSICRKNIASNICDEQDFHNLSDIFRNCRQKQQSARLIADDFQRIITNKAAQVRYISQPNADIFMIQANYIHKTFITNTISTTI